MAGNVRVELLGDGVQALRTFLARQASITGGELGKDATPLTTAQLRHAASLLHKLHAEDPTTPSLATFLHGRVRVTAAATTPDGDGETEEDATEAAAKDAYLEQRRRKLRRLDEEMRYGRLVHNVKSKTQAAELEQFQTSTRQHLSIGANMVMARVTAFIALYMVARVLTDSETMRVVIGLVGAIVMMVIEMVLFITRAAKYEVLERDQRRRGPAVF
ncbi:hypothetical protein PybrP1_004790 [[Pythium] brassicae (nom. inval.)]|nr:hypothetical protein PybrP1_004790 [[Pythium] brassicae (nom. inval.)]